MDLAAEATALIGKYLYFFDHYKELGEELIICTWKFDEEENL